MEAIQYYVKGAFQGVAESPEALEQQEELIADLTAKVADLVADGKSEDEALGVAIASLGDLSGLVAEFAPAATQAAAPPTVAPIPTVEVQATRLDFHVVAMAVALDAAFMLVCTVLGALTETIDSGAGVTLFLVLIGASWWIYSAWLKYQANPEAIESRELVYRPRLTKAVGLWAAACSVALVMNVGFSGDFWLWPLWVAATVMPIKILVERWMTTRETFASIAVAPEGAAAGAAVD